MLQEHIISPHKTLLDALRTNSRNIIGRNPAMVIPLLANQDLTPVLAMMPISLLNKRKVNEGYLHSNDGVYEE